jgi:ankyrin repeat protein
MGTPLAFAVSVASQEAVEILLYLGSDPIHCLQSSYPDLRNRNPINLAVSLHLVDILALLLREAYTYVPYALIQQPELLKVSNTPAKREAIDRSECLKLAWRSLAQTSRIERTFIHGRHSIQAGEQVVGFLRAQRLELSITREPMLTTESLIISTIEMGDVELASVGLASPKLTGDGSLEPVLSVENRNLLMLMCTKAACSGAFDNGKAIELLEFALARGSNVDCGVPGIKAQRAVNTAIEHHRVEILDWFIDKKADLNTRDAQGNYPLHHMIDSGFSSTYPLSKLLAAGADANTQQVGEGGPGNSPLHLAIKTSKFQEASVLLDQGQADPTLQCDGTMRVSALHCAVRTGNLELVSLVLQYRSSADPGKSDLLNQRDGFGNSPLLLAASQGEADIVKLLLNVGADLTVVNNDGLNVLHCAAVKFHYELIPILEGKVDINTKVSVGGETALHLVTKNLGASDDRASLSAAALIEAGADPALQSDRGINPLYLIGLPSSGVDEEVNHRIRRPLLELIAKRGISLDNKVDGFQVPCMLRQAIENHDPTFVQDLLDLGAFPDITDGKGWTPLRRCASLGYGTSFTKPGSKSERICRAAGLLIAKGADIYSRDVNGLSLLDHAILATNAPMVFLLLEKCKSDICQNSGKSMGTLPLAENSPSETSYREMTRRVSRLGRFKDIMNIKRDKESLEIKSRAKILLDERFRDV